VSREVSNTAPKPLPPPHSVPHVYVWKGFGATWPFAVRLDGWPG
jgi:hypothetical protein